MIRLSHASLFAIAATCSALALFVTATAAAPASVNVNGKIYYVVSGNDPKMDTGAEVCASIGKVCKGYGTIATNAVCVKFHPTARATMSIHGSKAEYYCDGSPQTGAACSAAKNTCAVCPACNLNEASTCTQPIGGHFREMYVECATPVIRTLSSRRTSSRTSSSLRRSSSSRRTSSLSRRSSSSRRVSSSRSASRRSASSRSGVYGPLPQGPQPDARIGQHPGNKVCEFYQATRPGDPVRATKKLVTCSAFRAGDTFCVLSMQSTQAKAVKCEENGIVVCTLPCNAPGIQNLRMCAADINRPRGNNAPPLDFCGGTSSRAASSAPTKKRAGELCQHGGDCQSGMCLGVVPGREYRCSCIDPMTRWQSCTR